MLTMKFCDVKDKRTSELAKRPTHERRPIIPQCRTRSRDGSFPISICNSRSNQVLDVCSRSIDIALPAYWHRRSHSSRNSNKYRTSNKKDNLSQWACCRV